MNEYVITLLAAAAVTYILTPVVRRFAIAVGAMHAARERDVHEMPTPLLGGFAIYGGLAAALLLASRLSGLNSVFIETNMAKGLLLAGGLVVIMGFVDDRWGMGALSKLAGQVAAGVILVWSGAEIPWLPEPGGVAFILTNDQQVAVTILVVVVTMNAVNFIDGLDGLAAGIVGIGAIAFFGYYFTLVHRLGLLGQSEPALVSVLLAGVCLGFLPHNFYPARIFMGDTGSMLIGLLLAYAPISSLALLAPASLTDTQAYAAGTVNRYGAFIPLLVPGAILLIPYADLLMAVVRRTRAGKSVFAPDKKHLQHRLLAIGHSHRTSVLIMYLWAALFSGTVIWLSIVRTPLIVLAIVTVAAVLCLLLFTMPRLRPWSRTSNGDGPVPRPAPVVAAPAVPLGVARAAAVPVVTAPEPGTRPAVPRGASRRPAAPAAVPEEVAAGRPAGMTPARTGPGRGQPAPAVSPDEAGRPPAGRSGPGNGAAGNSATGNDSTGNGAVGNGAAGNGNGAAGNGAAAKPAELAWYRDGDPGVRSRDAGRAVPPWESQDAGISPDPAAATLPDDRAVQPRGASRDALPWDTEGAAASPGWSRPVPSWDAGRSAPSPEAGWSRPVPAAGRAVPPWEAPLETGRSAVPLPDTARAVPPWAAGRSVPPWELPQSADPEGTGPMPARRWPGQPGSPAEAPDGSGNGQAAPPWQPGSPPWPPAAPPWA